MCDNPDYDYVPETKKGTNSVESEEFSSPKQFAWPAWSPFGCELRASIRRVERTSGAEVGHLFAHWKCFLILQPCSVGEHATDPVMDVC